MTIKLGGTTNGIKVEIYAGNDHNPPHAHIKYGEYEVRCTIQSPFILLDSDHGFPRSKLKIGIKYIKNNHERLLRNFIKANPHLRNKK